MVEPMKTLAQLVRRFREAIALASSGDLVGLASRFTKHAHVDTEMLYRHVNRRGPQRCSWSALTSCLARVVPGRPTGHDQRKSFDAADGGTHFVVAVRRASSLSPPLLRPLQGGSQQGEKGGGSRPIANPR